MNVGDDVLCFKKKDAEVLFRCKNCKQLWNPNAYPKNKCPSCCTPLFDIRYETEKTFPASRDFVPRSEIEKVIKNELQMVKGKDKWQAGAKEALLKVRQRLLSGAKTE